MKTEIERAQESIKEYRKGYGQSQLPTDCIIQLMIGHAKSEQLLIQRVTNRFEKYCDSCEHETEHRIIHACLKCDGHL